MEETNKDKTGTAAHTENNIGLQMPVIETLTSRVSFTAEGMGFFPPMSQISRRKQCFSPKSYQSNGFSHSDQFLRVPVVTSHGVHRQGQNRDKFSVAWVTLFFSFLTLSLVISADSNPDEGGGADEAPPGRSRGGRRRSDRGLPDEQTLFDLVATYLELQHKLWPGAVEQQALPTFTSDVAQQLADQFRQRFLDLAWQPSSQTHRRSDGEVCGAVYLRYSCDNSSPRSLPQQLRNCLETAARLKVFVAWEYVFADAAVTGTVANRRGYQQMKQVIEQPAAQVNVFLIDELGRAARDTIESLKLGRLVKRFHKRVVGASDGFDSDSPQSQMMLTVYAMLHEQFVEQLRAKVGRGMTDAFRLGRNIRPAGFGYKLVVRYDASGQMILDNKGRPDTEKAVDEEQAEIVRQIFGLYADKKWSTERIARHLNDAQAGGRRTWNGSNLRKWILQSRIYIGEECEGMNRVQRDPETGKVTYERLPESETM